MFDISLWWSAMPALVNGAWLTLTLTTLAVLAGIALALPVAMCRNAPLAGLRAIANAYILFFRGTPALVQLFLLYYGSGQFELIRHSFMWPVLRDPFWCVVIALGLNSAAYTGKTLASALATVPASMREGAFVLGLSRLQAFWQIELPLAVRSALPVLGNEIVLTCKATSLASTVTLMELTGTARLLAAESYAPYEVFLGAGLVYLALNYTVLHGMRRLEMFLGRSR